MSRWKILSYSLNTLFPVCLIQTQSEISKEESVVQEPAKHWNYFLIYSTGLVSAQALIKSNVETHHFMWLKENCLYIYLRRFAAETTSSIYIWMNGCLFLYTAATQRKWKINNDHITWGKSYRLIMLRYNITVRSNYFSIYVNQKGPNYSDVSV